MLHRPKHASVTRNLEGTESQVMRPQKPSISDPRRPRLCVNMLWRLLPLRSLNPSLRTGTTS